MICFQLSINGNHICTAGVGTVGVLTAILTWAKRADEARPADSDASEWSEEELYFHVAGSRGHSTEGLEFLNWIEHHKVAANDVITIKVLDQDTCDPPVTVRVDTAESAAERKRKHYEMLKAEFEEDSV